MSRPRLLDLCCCQGGASKGYANAGFEVEGVDIEAQPLYPFRFWMTDALKIRPRWIRSRFDAVHVSPPCPGYSTMSNRHGSTSPKLIAAFRELLQATRLPYVIENVCGAHHHMRDALMLHGGQFDLNIYRPRLFESNVLLMGLPPARTPKNVVAVYGKREDCRLLWTRTDGTELRAASLEDAREAMGMPWADWTGVREAIPPAYTEHIGAQLLEHLAVAS